MNSNVSYWRNWFKWAQAAVLTLARTEPLGAATFMAEFGTTVALAFEPFDSLAACFKGSFFQVASKLTAWVATHHDPLGAFRHAAEAMKVKWTPNA